MAEKVSVKKGAQKKVPAKKGSATPEGNTETTAGITKIEMADVPVKGDTKILIGTKSPLIDGEFRGDFTRDTFDPRKHYTRVLMQQGRVQLDADWNEQGSILLHYLQALAADLIGPFGGPQADCGFEIMPVKDLKNDFVIGNGRYYVNGVLCENEGKIRYAGQFSGKGSGQEMAAGKTYVVYLDAWERTISCIEDSDIRDVALGGPDTAVRAKTEWMVRASDTLFESTDNRQVTCSEIREKLIAELPLLPSYQGLMKPAMTSGDRSDDICIINPDTKYRGVENQLYRVEIHTGGTAGNATFKWSRENGSVQFPILAMEKKKVILGNLGRDELSSMEPGNFVEIIDDDYIKQGYDLDDLKEMMYSDKVKIEKRRLYEVTEVDRAHLTVTLADDPGLSYDKTSQNHPVLRRWDHTKPDAKDNCTAIIESTDKPEKYFDLEDGIRIRFLAGPTQEKTWYLPGNYWLIPARVVTGALDWPVSGKEYVALPPHGVIHGYAPLGIIACDGNGTVSLSADCRCQFRLQLYCKEDK